MIKVCFNKDWKFALGTVPLTRGAEKTVDLPHDFMIEQSRDANSLTKRDGGYFPGGLGWYSKEFIVPEEWNNKRIYVEFEGVYMNAEVKINGNYIGRQNYGYTTFQADLTPFIKYGDKNIVQVLVDNTAVPNSRWYSGSGIYRYAWLYAGDSEHINFNGVYAVTKSVSADSAVLNISTDIINDGNPYVIEHVITENHPQNNVGSNTGNCCGKVAATVKSATKSIDVVIENPKLWDIDSPNLYTITTNYYINGQLKDTAQTTYGIRTFSIDTENGFILNGKKLKLKGGCLHHDNGILGSASYFRSEERKIEILKQSGFNAVRTAHNPPAPAFLDACDRLGMIVMDEAFDQWKRAKTQYDYHKNFESDWDHDIVGMVLRDRNHPSVIFWSTGNEIAEQTGDSGAAITSRILADTIRKYDDRPVGMAIMPYDESNPKYVDGIDDVVSSLDFVGYNYQHGKYERDNKKYPKRVIIGTETVPKDIFASWEETLKNPNVLGDFVWTAVDYLGEAGIGRVYYTNERPEVEWHLYDYPWNQAYCGDIDVCGFKRPQSYYRDILWGVSDKPKMFARRHSNHPPESEKVTYWGWNDGIEGWDFDVKEGTNVIVDIYSPAESVELFLNGESVGKNTLAELKTVFTVPYKKGELKAVDSNNNAVILSSSEKAAKIKLTADRDQIKEYGDLSYVTVEITDINGKTVTNAVNEVLFFTEGPGKIVAVGSANPKTTEMYVGNKHCAYDGKLMVVVKSISEGTINLYAVSEGLERNNIVIKAF